MKSLGIDIAIGGDMEIQSEFSTTALDEERASSFMQALAKLKGFRDVHQKIVKINEDIAEKKVNYESR